MSLSFGEAEALFGQMLDGGMADDDIRALLIELSDRGETAEEIAGAASAMRARMKRIAAPANAIDVCGTGGDGQHSLNISTAVALVVAACGVPVAKHGNRAASSKAGAADTLEALGLNLARAGEMAEQTLPDLGIAFLFAQAHHPAGHRGRVQDRHPVPHQGEVVGAGSIVMTLARLDEVTLTVYIPEDQYGRIQLGQDVSVSTDSYPGEVFQGKVEYISDQAEFTPRNVQTVEGRKSTVYAVKIALPNPEHRLKPGMPADARFH